MIPTRTRTWCCRTTKIAPVFVMQRLQLPSLQQCADSSPASITPVASLVDLSTLGSSADEGCDEKPAFPLLPAPQRRTSAKPSQPSSAERPMEEQESATPGIGEVNSISIHFPFTLMPLYTCHCLCDAAGYLRPLLSQLLASEIRRSFCALPLAHSALYVCSCHSR